MGLMWVTTVGFAICLGIVGGVFIYYLKTALDSEDAHRIDPAPKEE